MTTSPDSPPAKPPPSQPKTTRRKAARRLGPGLAARAAAQDLLADVLLRHRLLDDAFDGSPDVAALPDRDRAFVRLLAATTLRHLGRIDDLVDRCLARPLPAAAAPVRMLLRLGACQLVFLDTPPHAAISTAVDLVKHGSLAGYGGLINAVLRRIDREGRDWAAAQDGARLDTPDWLWSSWVAAYGEETARAIAEAGGREAPTDITVGGDPAPWAERLDAEILPTGSLRRRQPGDVAALPGYDEGVWWVQDTAAALPARLLGPVADRRVADLCAAPGGKTLQLAAAGARVTALDRSAARLRRLEDNLRRTGLTATIVAADAAEWRPEDLFDAVLLDAPCTATGTLRRHPDGLRLKGPADIPKMAAVQARLLRAAADMVAPGGRLIYCVCSLQTEEGPGIVDPFLAERPDFVRRPIGPDEVGGLPALLSPEGDLRTLPCHLAEQGGMDAFFAARLERREP
jgi:16S rRNA (cytosine967-C5)-methyltransferase